MTKPNQQGTEGTAPLEKWEIVVARAMTIPGVALPLAEIYAKIDGHARTKINPHWRDKVRQVLQRSALFQRVDKGVWMLTNFPTDSQLEGKR